MHCSLKIPEVVALICREVVPSYERDDLFRTQKTLVTLAASARTCKALSAPALDLLRMYQESIMPVLRCMSEDVRDEDGEVPSPSLAWLSSSIDFVVYCPRRPVVPVDWKRPFMYTHRIRSFKYYDRFHGRISPEFLETLRLCVPGEQVFPNLGNLE
jgi:hypothetical protein